MEDIYFWVDFVAGKSNKLQKLGLEGKISWALNVELHIAEFGNFQSENVKNKECVYTWANGTGCTSAND